MNRSQAECTLSFIREINREELAQRAAQTVSYEEQLNRESLTRETYKRDVARAIESLR